MARKNDQPLTVAQAKLRLRATAGRIRRRERTPGDLLLAFAAGWLVGRGPEDPLTEPLAKLLTCIVLGDGRPPARRREPGERRDGWPRPIEDN